MSSTPCPKRRRCASLSADLRSSILSTFRVSDSAEAFFGTGPFAKPYRAVVGQSPAVQSRSHSDLVLGNLACISTESGTVSYRAVVDGLRNRSLSTPAVASALVEGDDAEEATPLCWVITLLQEAVLRTADFDPTGLAQRCRLEIGSSTMTCQCPPPGPFGLKGLIEVVLGDGISRARDAVLEALIEPLHVGREQYGQGDDCELALRLAARALETLKLYGGDIEDYEHLIKGWIMESLKVRGDIAGSREDARLRADDDTRVVRCLSPFIPLCRIY
jgi:hypothetical protein